MKKLFLLLSIMIIISLIMLLMDKASIYNLSITITWVDYIIEVLPLGMILLVNFSLIILYIIAKILNIINSFPEKYRNLQSNKYIKQDLENLLQSYIFMITGEISDAKKNITKNSNYILSKILQLQIAFIEKDDFLAEKLINELVLNKNTKFIAYKYLVDLKFSQKKFHASLKAALLALELRPDNNQLKNILAEIYLNLNSPEQSYQIYQTIDQKNCQKLSNIAFSVAKYHYEHNDTKEALIWIKKSFKDIDMDIESWFIKLDLLMKLESKPKSFDLIKDIRQNIICNFSE